MDAAAARQQGKGKPEATTKRQQPLRRKVAQTRAIQVQNAPPIQTIEVL